MDIKTEILYQYPFPIAVTYLNADNVREPVGAHDQRLRLFEVTLKFLSSVAIAQYIHDRLDDPRVKRVLRGLVRPSLGQWNAFLREVLNAYRRAGRLEDMLIPELYNAYNKKRSDRPAMARAYNEIVNFLQSRTDSSVSSISLRQFCDAMISYRNKTIGHGAITRYHCERFNDPLFAALEEMLEQLGFLKEHRLVYIEEVRVRRGHYTHEMMSFMGSTPPSRMREAYVTDDQAEYRVEEQLYLCARGENVPMLSLHPLVIAWQGDILFLNESERERGIEYLSYQSGQIKKPDRLLEDFKEILGFLLAEEREEPSFERLRRQAMAVVSPVLTPYEQGCEAFEAGNWAAAIRAFSKVTVQDPDYADAQSKLTEARRQQELLERYSEGQRLMEEGKWAQAQETLEKLEQDAPGYRDVRALLEQVRVERAQEEALDRLYAEVKEAIAAHRWERAYDLLRHLHDLRPDFRDVRALLDHHRRLHDLYERAVQAMGGRRWAEAQTALRQIQVLEPKYRNVASLLKRAEHELEAEAQLADWYGQAKAHIALGEWNKALELLDQIADVRKDYRDVPRLIKEVQSKILVPCPRCGAWVPSGYKFCPKCGAAIKTWICWRCRSPVPQDRKFCGKCGAPRERPKTVICPYCGYENLPGRKFCGRCGRPLTGQSQPRRR